MTSVRRGAIIGVGAARRQSVRGPARPRESVRLQRRQRPPRLLQLPRELFCALALGEALLLARLELVARLAHVFAQLESARRAPLVDEPTFQPGAHLLQLVRLPRARLQLQTQGRRAFVRGGRKTRRSSKRVRRLRRRAFVRADARLATRRFLRGRRERPSPRGGAESATPTAASARALASWRSSRAAGPPLARSALQVGYLRGAFRDQTPLRRGARRAPPGAPARCSPGFRARAPRAARRFPSARPTASQNALRLAKRGGERRSPRAKPGRRLRVPERPPQSLLRRARR